MDRRGFLAALGVAGGAGCLGAVGSISSRGSDGRVSVLSAGSLALAFDDGVGPAFEDETGIDYRGEYHGSAALLRMVREGTKRPDVVVSADAGLLRDRLEPDLVRWDVTFASNALTIAYAPDTEVGARLEAGDPWYRVFLEADEQVARSDPAIDPLGYRTLQAFDLAADHYGVDGLRSRLADALVVDPEEAHLLAGLETGTRAAAVCYRNMAVGHGLPSHDLPTALDFSDPSRADHYATASYTLPDGTVVRGTPVVYAATVPTDALHSEAGRRFVRFLSERPDLLADHGLVVTDAHPGAHGDVPEEVLP